MESGRPGALEGKRVVLAGGSGLVGRHLSKVLAGSGARVAILSRSPGRPPAVPGVELHGWDELPQLVRGAWAVVNLAGENLGGRRWTAAFKRRLLESRIETTRAIVAAMAAAEARPELLLSASAVGIYGDRPGSSCDESSPAATGFLPDLCSAWEAAADAATGLGIRVVKLRMGVVLAKDGGALPRFSLPVRCFLGAAIGGGSQMLSWIHVDDLIDLALAILQDPSWSGVVNATAPVPVRQKDFLRSLGRRLRRPILPLPAGLSALAARVLLGEMASPLLLEGAAVLPRKALERSFAFRFPNVEAALADLLPGPAASAS